MSGRPCEREESIVRAVLEGTLGGPLEAHVEGCAECREAARVTAWMRDVAAAAREAAAEGLPDPAEIWWRAEVLGRVERRRSLVRRAVQPIALFERWAGVGAAVVAAAVAWGWGDRVVVWVAQHGRADLLADPANATATGLVAAVALAASAAWFVERLGEV